MARKTQQNPATVHAEPLKAGAIQISVINLKGTQAYRDWIRGFRRHSHIAPTTLVRLAMADLASKYGYKPPPEK